MPRSRYRMSTRADARMRATMSRDRRTKAAKALRAARSRASRLRTQLKESESKGQIEQLGYTVAGGALGGAAVGMMPEGIMGMDPRLVGGLAAAVGCFMLKGKGIQTPLCGLASGMLSSYVGDMVAGMLETDDTIPLSEVS